MLIIYTLFQQSYVQIVSGLQFVCGIKIDQTVQCAGKVEPTVPGLFTQLSTGDNHVCGVLTTGQILCWGMFILMNNNNNNCIIYKLLNSFSIFST